MKRKKRKKRVLQIVIMLLSVIALIVVVGLTYMDMKPMVVKAVTIEAGTPSIGVEKFLIEEDRIGSFITDIDNLNLKVPGTYEIQIKVGRKTLTSDLEIVDSIPPEAEAVEVIALKDEGVDASSFVTNVSDATDVKISFVSEPDTSTSGEKEVKIALEDAGKNVIIIDSKLTVLDVKSAVQVEAGTTMNVKPEDFVVNDSISVFVHSNLSQLDISTPTVHPIELEVDGRILKSSIEVIDTTPPSALPVNKEAWKGEALSPVEFVKEVSDVSAIKVSFDGQPDFESIGSQEITVIVEDFYGNKIHVKPILTIKEDIEPPVFSGIKNRTIFEGDSVSYKKGVTVSDNKDKDITFQVDSSKVNLSKVGTYKVSYTAKDSSGNKASETATITVEPFIVTDEMLNDKVDKVLAKITKDSMTKEEKAWEIYEWVKGHVAYTGSSDKSDWKKEAYRGIVNGLGDCFTYYAVSEAFLTRAGIDNMRVTRVGGRTQHFWNLIDCGDGWYHFDTCPNKDKMQAFMLTDAEVEAYTKKRGNNYYNYDKSLYPASPER